MKRKKAQSNSDGHGRRCENVGCWCRGFVIVWGWMVLLESGLAWVDWTGLAGWMEANVE